MSSFNIFSAATPLASAPLRKKPLFGYAPVQTMPAYTMPLTASPTLSDQVQISKTRITKGAYSPSGSDSYKIPVEIHTQGDGKFASIIERTSHGYQIIGMIANNGNFVFNTAKGPQKGSIFEDGNILTIDFQDGMHPFLTTLRQNQQQLAMQRSEAGLIRQNLTSKGITGAGVTVADVEPFEEQDSDDGESIEYKLADHTRAVGSMVNDPVWGVAPGAQVLNYGFIENDDDFDVTEDSYSQLYQKIIGEYTATLGHADQQIQRILTDRQINPSVRCINFSWGATETLIYLMTLATLEDRNDNDDYKFPQLRQIVLGQSEYGNSDQKLQAVVDFVTRTLANNPQIQKAHQDYINTTRQAAEQGVFITVSTGNEGNPYGAVVKPPPGAEYNILAKSPYVIGVAAADTNGQPGNRAQYRIAEFSSPGDGVQWNPTIAAPGEEMILPDPFGPLAKNKVSSGTSYSSPFTAATIALMVQKRQLSGQPNLTFTEVVNTLKQTATPVPFTPAETGAGMLSAEKAVASA